ncbi:hypothetical protein RG47T_3846 [Mucilaginibacter polytrichastri]|uniref:Uncharacterized protein n=1 Tax=Mucilaginibacter polytrichastri TaxID=1302689 RepID=A0A1Q6A2Z6_9SPHI|nr:hypothetical protein RG47T_3846 [Mucilaginibacter polytrichastri]
MANETHVRLAVGRNFLDCSPVKGVYKGSSGHHLEVAVSVGYQDHEPEPAIDQFVDRVTKPGPFAGLENDTSKNSYQRYMEMIQQQQQQQQ